MNKYFKYIFLIPAAAVLSGCLRDSHSDVRIGEGFIEVELGLEIADEGLEHTLTRAFSPEDEDRVETLDVLVFEYDGTLDGRFRYATHGYDINKPENIRTFKTMLATEYVNSSGVKTSLIGKQIFILVLANVRDSWNYYKNQIPVDATVRNVVDKLVFIQNGNWDVSDGSTQYFPMTSIPLTRPVVSPGLTGSDFGTIKLTRAVAAIDIGFNYDTGDVPLGFEEFELEEVILCNVPDRGMVSNVFCYGGHYQPFLPDTYLYIQRKYTLSQSSKYGLFNEIYIPEKDLVNMDQDPDKRPYMLIGGKYNGSDSWYRIEFPTSGSSPSYSMKILRNWRYIVKIDRIYGPGYGSREEAEAGEAKDSRMWMNLTVVPFSERTVTPEINDNYTFDVSQTSFFFEEPRSSYSATLDLYTDYAEGWRVDDITYEVDPGSRFWLRTDAIKGAPFVQGHLDIMVDQNFYSDNGRVAYIHLSAGRWKYKIRVQQGQVVDLNVTPASRTISFWSHRNGPTPQNTFEVNSRLDWSCSVTYTSGGDWGLEVYKTADNKGFYVQCDRNETLGVRHANVTITSGGCSVVVPITQDWAECGIGGKTALADFGGTQTKVKTHLYGGNPRELFKYQKEINDGPYEQWTDIQKDILLNYPEGEHYACWMVENSSYGNPDAINYNGVTSQVGPYYSAVNAVGACPEGWRLPGYNELFGMAALSLVLEYDNKYFGEDELAAYQAWISDDNTLAGMCANSYWMGWKETGYFYSDWDGISPTGRNVLTPIGLHTGINLNMPIGFEMKVLEGFTIADYWTVRCVREKTYTYE